MPAKRKPENTSRSETVTVRLDPKLHYLAGIAARETSRTLSGFIEWALRRTMADAEVMRAANEPMPGSWPAPPPQLWGETLWDVDEADRFYNLATLHPGLLTIPEQRFWKLFCLNTPEISPEGFREFWNAPAIDTTHLKLNESGE